jgi:diguanylate cyclase (GGDEF)-like protein
MMRRPVQLFSHGPKFFVVSFLWVFAIAAVIALALSSLLTRAFLQLEWDNTATLVRREVHLVGADGVFTPPGTGQGAHELARRLTDIPGFVRVTVWDRRAAILWTDDQGLIGRRFSDHAHVRTGLAGRVVGATEETRPGPRSKRPPLDTVAEVYVPIFRNGTDIAGVVEVGKTAVGLFNTIRWGTIVIWAVSLAGALALYMVLIPLLSRKAREEKLAHQAFHDPLTGLPNRALFMDRLARAFSRRHPIEPFVGVLFIDLDRFKLINDSLGHQAGDRLLIATTQRLQGCVRPEDTLARLGGDEFAVLVEALPGVADATAVAQRIEAELRAPFDLDGREVFVSASVGIALADARRGRPDDLLRDADLAMYQAKKNGKARFDVFHPGMSARALEHLELETDLRHAVGRGELRLHYQPLVAPESGRIVEMEALVRWDHPRRGLLTPAEFMPLAEETGLILEVGEWVLREACAQARTWQARFPGDPPLMVSVNVSARQLQQPDLVDQVATALAETGVPPASLKLEITENAVAEDSDAMLARLRALKNLGVQLAVDDFGSGYSSLNHLKRLPVDAVKIDRSFVEGIGRNPVDTRIVRAVVDVARTLNLTVTAEGIETPDQLAHVRALGCDRGQGYYVAPPASAELMSALLEANTAAPRPIVAVRPGALSLFPASQPA